MSIRFALKVSRKQQSWFASKSFANDADYKTFMKEVEKTPKLVVVDWYATWCLPCKGIAPLYERLSENHPEAVYIKMDVDKFEQSAAEANVEAMPTFQFYKSGKLISQFAGANYDKLQETVVKNK